jgi:hypothetical protein
MAKDEIKEDKKDGTSDVLKISRGQKIENQRIEGATQLIKEHGRSLEILYLLNGRIIPDPSISFVPPWRRDQNLLIERSIKEIRENQDSVNLIVMEDETFYDETIAPLQALDAAYGQIVRLEGRKLETQKVNEFRDFYKTLIENINDIIDISGELLYEGGITKSQNKIIRNSISKARNKKSKVS